MNLKQRRIIGNADTRQERAWAVDAVSLKILSCVDDTLDKAEVGLMIVRWHADDEEGARYWSGALHQLLLDLFMCGPKESRWLLRDLDYFRDSWLMLDSDCNIREEYEFSRILYEHIGIDRDFFRKTVFWGLQTCGIMPSDVSIQSQVLIQWEAESGCS